MQDKIDAAAGVTDVYEILGQFVDPTNVKAIKVTDTKIIINSTQVSQAAITGIVEALGDKYNIVRVTCDPSNVYVEGENNS